MPEASRPPLGPMPRFLWEEDRMDMLKDAIEDHLDAGFRIDIEWVQEWNELAMKNRAPGTATESE